MMEPIEIKNERILALIEEARIIKRYIVRQQECSIMDDLYNEQVTYYNLLTRRIGRLIIGEEYEYNV